MGGFYAKRNTQFILLCASYVLLLSLSVLRDVSVGKDFLGYQLEFTNYNELGMRNERIESVWHVIFSFFYKYFDFRTYVFFFYSILYFFILRFIWKESKYPLIGVLLYFLCGFYFDSFNIMRQSFALIFVLFAIKNIKERNFIKFFIFIFIGSLFHYSTLFCIPLYFISFINKLDYKKFKLICVVLILVSVVLGYTDYISKYVADIVLLFGDFDKYSQYLKMKNESFSLTSYIVSFFPSIVAVTVIAATKNRNIITYVGVYILGIIINNLFINFQWIFRFSTEFLIFFSLVVWSNTIKDISNKIIKICFVTFIIIYAIGTFYLALKNNYNGVVPYISI